MLLTRKFLTSFVPIFHNLFWRKLVRSQLHLIALESWDVMSSLLVGIFSSEEIYIISYTVKKQLHFWRKVIAWFIILTFNSSLILPPQRAYAQTILNLPVPGSVVPTTAIFAPAMIKGINLYPDNPLKFDFIIDKGDTAFTDEEFEKESTKLIKYFLSSLTVPEDEIWVNLSPSDWVE